MGQGKQSPSAQASRMRRRWVRRAPGVIAVSALLGIGAAQVLLEDPIPRPVAAWEPKRVPREETAAKPIESVLVTRPPRAERRRSLRPEVAPVVSAPPHERLRALKELERTNPAAAASTAARLVHDPEELVRVNAVAVLARSSSPEAARVLAALDPASQRLASALRERR